ncbi:MAG: chitobiase/beta-hexosaminidase C-terminal domain-containing protein [Bacteroidales bacterium]|nr:chitobiase/beta-hexosaminidase C-terminal domain-containing protein [Bacteroidales bacterium]
MVTFQRRLVLISLLFVLSVLAAFSQSNNVNYTFKAPVIDGVIDSEWVDFESKTISNIIEGEVLSLTDLDGTFKMLWNEGFLYLLVVVNDDVIHSSNADDISLDDGIEVFIDGNNDKPYLFEEDDFRFAFRANDQKVYEYSKDTVVGVVFAQTVIANTVIYEIQIPWNVIGQANIRNNEEIGFDIHVNDNDEDDEEAEREGKIAWYVTSNSIDNPSLFGTVLLSGKPSLGIMTEPQFSQKRGFCNAPFMLTLSSSKEETEIIYTLDGSDPRYSPTAIRGMSPLTVEINPAIDINRGGLTPSVVVRALAAKANYETSEVVTHSYIFLENVKKQTNPGGIWPPPYVNNFLILIKKLIMIWILIL